MKRKISAKKTKSKNKPRREGSVAEELEFLRGENKELRARCQRLAKELKRTKSSVKDDLQDLEDLAKEAVSRKKLKTAIVKCSKCSANMIEQKLPHATMYSCVSCNNVEIRKH